MRLFRILAALPLALALLTIPAAAQVSVSSTQIDLSPIVETLIPIIMTLVTAGLGWIGWYVKNLVAAKVDLSNTQLDEQIQQTFNEATARGMAYAETVVKGSVPKTFDAKSEFVAAAAGYVIKFWPDLIKKLGMTPENVKATIIARLPSGEQTEKADAIVLAKAAGQSPEPEKK